METKPVIDPQLEEEKLHNRKNQYFARLAGAVGAVTGGIATGYYKVKESLLTRVSNQINMRDWSRTFFPESTMHTHATPDKAKWFSTNNPAPDPSVKSAIEDLYKNNTGFIKKISENYRKKVSELKESRELRFDGIIKDFTTAAEKKADETPALASQIRAEIARIRAEFAAIHTEADPDPKHARIQHLIDDLKKKFYPDSALYTSAEKNTPLLNAMRESGLKLHERLNKEHNNFFNYIDHAKKKLIDKPIFEELIKADNQPGHMGLGFRHADFKHKIFFKAGAAAVAMGAVAWGGVRLLQLFKDRSDLQEQKGYLKRELGRREANALDNFENHARA